MKYVKEFRDHFSKQPVFTINEAKIFLKNRKISQSYLHQFVHYLLKKHELIRISRGVYTFHDDVSVAGFAFRPFYYGLEDALSIHGLWQQETNPVVVTIRKVRTGVRSFNGRNYVVRHIAREMFFGYELIRHSEFWLPVATIEKTLIDFFYFRIPLSEELSSTFRESVNKEKLNELLLEIPKKQRKHISDKIGAILGDL